MNSVSLDSDPLNALEQALDLFRNSGFVEFLDYFGRFSIQIVGAIY